MRLLSTFFCLHKRHEASTDESMRTASTWRKNRRLMAWSRDSTSGNNTASKKHKKKMQQQEMLDASLQLETGDDETDSGLDIFQTLMSNSIAPLRTGAIGVSNSDKATADLVSANNRSGINKSMNPWYHTDPTFLPTAYPLSRSDPRSSAVARWGTLDLAASAALLEKPLKRFNEIRDKRPRFRLGPRNIGGSDHEDSRSSAASSTLTALVDSQTPKYAFISQDGRLVEREIYRWPTHKPQKLTLRYKLLEPYASNYGKAKRKYSSPKYPLLRSRYIYQRPIFMLPRSVMDENKRRLLARHAFKDRVDPITDPIKLPYSVTVGYSEQCRKYMEYQMLKYTREAIERIVYVEKLRDIAREKLI